MEEKKLSEELRHCLEDGGCGDCQYHKPETKMICKGLLQKAYERIKEYEEMEEQGKIIKLPFTTGDEVWIVDENKIFRCKVMNFEFCNRMAFAVVEKKMIYEENMGYIRVPIGNFGKTVFLTKSAAEQKLRQLENKGSD